MRLIKNLEIYEVSIVSNPANPYCKITSVDGISAGIGGIEK